MGANASTTLTREEIDELLDMTTFTADEIKVLYHRFMKLDREKKGIVTVDDFLMIPELAMNPLSQRIVEMFDSDADGNINFKFFVSALSVFHDKASEEQKKHFLFAVYDVDSDGYIGSEDMVRIFDLMVGDSMEKHKLTQAVDEIIDAADKDGDGKLSFQEFQSVIGDLKLVNGMSLQVKRRKDWQIAAEADARDSAGDSAILSHSIGVQ